jgi:hypothetical protein
LKAVRFASYDLVAESRSVISSIVFDFRDETYLPCSVRMLRVIDLARGPYVLACTPATSTAWI